MTGAWHRALAASIITLAAACAVAEERVYRVVSAHGEVAYSNQPQPGAALVMALPPTQRRPPPQVEPQPRPQQPIMQGTLPARAPQRAAGPALSGLIEQAARRHRIDAALLTAIIRQESGFDPQAVSRAGARGLMQLMPATARRYGVARVHDVGENIAAGSAYLRDLLDRYGRLDLALAAYNAGEGAVEKYGNQVPPYSETRNYVAAILADYRGPEARR